MEESGANSHMNRASGTTLRELIASLDGRLLALSGHCLTAVRQVQGTIDLDLIANRPIRIQ